MSLLELLRASMKALPEDRRRRVIAATQVPWFEPRVADELKRRALQADTDGQLLPLHKDWMAEHTRQHDEEMAVLGAILEEVKKIRGMIRQT